jgi:hypothetical protein
MIKIKNVLIFEILKGGLSVASGYFLFTILTMTLYVFLLPIDIFLAIYFRNKISFKMFGFISISLYVFLVLLAILLISNGYREQLRFLLDLDAW